MMKKLYGNNGNDERRVISVFYHVFDVVKKNGDNYGI